MPGVMYSFQVERRKRGLFQESKSFSQKSTPELRCAAEAGKSFFKWARCPSKQHQGPAGEREAESRCRVAGTLQCLPHPILSLCFHPDLTGDYCPHYENRSQLF